MSIKYRGITFPGYNKPIKSNRAGKKKMVLAKKGETIRLIHFGATGYGHNYSAAARKSFRARHKCDTANDILMPVIGLAVHCGVEPGGKLNHHQSLKERRKTDGTFKTTEGSTNSQPFKQEHQKAKDC